MFFRIMLICSIIFSCTNSFAQNQESNIIIVDDFSNVSRDCFSNGRAWYTFGGLSLTCERGVISVKGQNLSVFAGFGIAPGANGENGMPIITNGKKNFVVEVEGTASALKVELYDSDQKQHAVWIGTGTNPQHRELPPKFETSTIAKMQFLTSPGNVDLKLKKIYFE